MKKKQREKDLLCLVHAVQLLYLNINLNKTADGINIAKYPLNFKEDLFEMLLHKDKQFFDKFLFTCI